MFELFVVFYYYIESVNYLLILIIKLSTLLTVSRLNYLILDPCSTKFSCRVAEHLQPLMTVKRIVLFPSMLQHCFQYSIIL